MSKKFIIGAAVALVVVVAAVAIKSRAGARPEYEVKTIKASRMDIDLSISASGIVTAKGQANLAAKAMGRIKKVLAEDGDKVKKGEALIELEAVEVDYQVESADINYGIAKNNYSISQNNLNIAKANLSKTQAGGSSQQLAVNQASVDQAKTSLDNAEVAVDDIESINDKAEEYADLTVEYADDDFEKADEFYELIKETTTNEIAIQEAKDGRDLAERNLELAELSREQTEARNAQALNQAKNQYDAANGAYVLSKAQYDLTKDPAGSYDITILKEQLEIAETGLDTARKQREIARIGYESAKEEKNNLTVKSPLAGVVTQLKAREGEIANPGAPLAVILDPETFQFEALIDETDIAEIKKGQKVKVVLDAYPDEELTGKITFIDLVSQLTSGGATSYKTIITFKKFDEKKLKAGMNGDSEIFVGKMRNKLVVPILAVDDRENKNVVFVVKTGRLVEERTVRTGVATDDYVEVTSGLKKGETVVAEGVGKLKDGDRIK